MRSGDFVARAVIPSAFLRPKSVKTGVLLISPAIFRFSHCFADSSGALRGFGLLHQFQGANCTGNGGRRHPTIGGNLGARQQLGLSRLGPGCQLNPPAGMFGLARHLNLRVE